MERGSRKEREGVVISTKMKKTVIVRVDRSIPHPDFRKIVPWNKKYYAHYEGDEIQEGHRVRIVETRPLSKLKRWRVIEVLS